MPFKKKSFRKYRKSRPWYKKKYSVGQIAGAALKGVIALKNIVNAEKHITASTVSETPSTSGVVINMTDVAQGDDAAQRTGRSVLGKSLILNASITKHASATASIVRVLVVKDKENQGTIPAITDLLTSASVNALRLTTSNAARWQMLLDRKYIVDSNQPLRNLKFYIKINSHVLYSGTASTDEDRGQYFLMLISSEATNTPSVAGTRRFTFYDN